MPEIVLETCLLHPSLKFNGNYGEYEVNSISPSESCFGYLYYSSKARREKLSKAPLLIRKSTFGCLLCFLDSYTSGIIRLSLSIADLRNGSGVFY